MYHTTSATQPSDSAGSADLTAIKISRAIETPALNDCWLERFGDSAADVVVPMVDDPGASA
jgi:hypothetical protein